MFGRVCHRRQFARRRASICFRNVSLVDEFNARRNDAHLTQEQMMTRLLDADRATAEKIGA